MTEHMKRAPLEADDDEISLTSSQSDAYFSDQEFIVERILSERKGPGGRMLYLILWADYPEEKATWEPRDNIQDPEILTSWKERKDLESKGAKATFDIAKFDARLQQIAQRKAERHRRRKAKRRRLNLPVSPDYDYQRDDSDSTEAEEYDIVPEDDMSMERKVQTFRKGKTPNVLSSSFAQAQSSDDDDPGAKDPSRTFVCDKCNHRFKRHDHLKRHALSAHTKEKPFECQECGRKFARSDYLVNHTRREHQSSNIVINSGEDRELLDNEVSAAHVERVRPPAKGRSSTHRDSHESDGAGTSDDSLIREVRRKMEKKNARNKAPKEIRDSRTTKDSSDSPTPPNARAPREASKLAGTRTRSSSFSDTPFAELVERRRQTQQRSESTDTAISKQLGSTVNACPRVIPSATPSISLPTILPSRNQGTTADKRSSGSGRGMGATRGGSSLSYRHVFSSREQPATKKRSTLIENAGDSSKGQKHFGNMHIVWKAQLAGRAVADTAPDLSVLGGLFPASDPSTVKSLNIRKGPPLANNSQQPSTSTAADDVFVSDSPPMQSAGAWDPVPDNDMISSVNYDRPAPIRPEYREWEHHRNAICVFWHKSKSCTKGFACDFQHVDDERLPIGPTPQGVSFHRENTRSITSFTQPHMRPWEKPDSESSPKYVCFFFHDWGACSKGNNCNYSHTDDGSLPIAPDPRQRDGPPCPGLPKDRDEICTFWASGYCRNSQETCLYRHGYPESFDTTRGRPGYEQPQREPVNLSTVVREEGWSILNGPKKSVSFADDEPMTFSDEPEHYDRPRSTHKSTVPYRNPKYNRICPFLKRYEGCWHGENCFYWHTEEDARIFTKQNDDKLGNRRDTVSVPQGIASGRPAKLYNPSPRQVSLNLNQLQLQTENLRPASGPQSTTPAMTPEQVSFAGRQYAENEPLPHSHPDTDIPVTSILTTASIENSSASNKAATLEKAEAAPPKPPRSKVKFNDYRRNSVLEALGDRAKEVAFGDGETKFVVADVGDITQVKHLPWGEAFAALSKLQFTHTCLAQDFRGQRDALVEETLWQGSLGPEKSDRDAFQILNKAWEHLRLSSAGFTSVCSDFVILVYPAIEEWKFIEGDATFPPEMRLRYLVFRSNFDFSAVPETSLATTNSNNHRKNLVGALHGLKLPQFFFKAKKGQNHHFYLLFPATACATADFFAKWLRASGYQTKLYSSQMEGSWSAFVKESSIVRDGPDTGNVLVHESAIASLCELPHLHNLTKKTHNFWYIADGADQFPTYGPSELSIPGHITATRLLPHGHAFLLTPSFLLSQPERAYELMKWFLNHKSKSSTPGTWKMVIAHNIRDYLLGVALEKSTEKDELETTHQGDPRKDQIIEDRGLSYSIGKIRFQLHELIVEAFAHSMTETYSDCDSDTPDEILSPIVYASECVDPDDEQTLVTWFSGWAMGKLDQFRRFTVVGSSSSSVQRAYRRLRATQYTDPTIELPQVSGLDNEWAGSSNSHPVSSVRPGRSTNGLPIAVEKGSIYVAQSAQAKTSSALMEIEVGDHVKAVKHVSGIIWYGHNLSAKVQGQFTNRVLESVAMQQKTIGTASVHSIPDSPSRGLETLEERDASLPGRCPQVSIQPDFVPSLDRISDGAGDERLRPSAADSNTRSRSGVQREESGLQVVPASVRPSGSIRPQLWIKSGVVPAEDQEVYRSLQLRSTEHETSHGGSQHPSHPSHPSTPAQGSAIPGARDADVMDIDSPSVEHIIGGSAESMKTSYKEIRYEATTTWYTQWQKEGKGWEHIYVDKWENCFKFLGLKR